MGIPVPEPIPAGMRMGIPGSFGGGDGIGKTGPVPPRCHPYVEDAVYETLAQLPFNNVKMRSKRSRHASSSTQHSTPMETDASASLSPTKVMKPSEADADEQLQPKVVNAVVRQSAAESDQLKMGGFLEKCHYCQKRIPQNSEVFMYSNLCAFCSAECRDFQIAKDQLAETQSGNPRDNMVQGLGIYNVKG
ncbi:hypothetical protein F511_26419 [Dorcoceras hygrometricum]|uniref:FLZ-type domain-containing protein n=1 Tax=Dorcoceras hygrometricum TaxID=472368 RepID=A0A2Z7CAU0_9LAMI|nr:hypothetical protein F511_26419 [Dorcoceras hygrometricum]